MQNILVIGAGRSSSSLIKYLLDHSQKEDWKITVGDVSLDLVQQKTGAHPNARAIRFDITDSKQREKEIAAADLVVSMLPANMHADVARDCVRLKKHLVTASYVSPEMEELHAGAKKYGIILLNEVGLDPGIDHMSAMKIIDEEKSKGNEIISFKSYCGGLIAPQSNDNPWGYKFTWNPRNVVLAGQAGARFIENGKMRFIPYENLFKKPEMVEVEGFGKFDAYANRDSLSYLEPYGLKNISTLLRGTLRMPGFCKAWDALIRLGLTNDKKIISGSETLTWAQLVKKLDPGYRPEDNEVQKKLEWLGIFSDQKITLPNATPAQILQQLLEEKWKLKEHDKDMIVMQHQFRVKTAAAKTENIISSLVVIGEDQVHTAMAKTVGLPAAISTKLILQRKIKSCGVVIPTLKEIYEPVLMELEKFQIKFSEKRN